MNKTIRLIIIKADAEKAGLYTDHSGCLLAQAAMRHFKTSNIHANYATLNVRKQLFVMTDAAAERVCGAHNKDDKVALHRFKPFSVTLKKYG